MPGRWSSSSSLDEGISVGTRSDDGAAGSERQEGKKAPRALRVQRGICAGGAQDLLVGSRWIDAYLQKESPRAFQSGLLAEG